MAIRVALDAMGGDQAPAAPVEGALAATEDGIDVILVGDAKALGGEASDAGVEVVHTPEAVGMGEDPAIALRAKPEASVRVAAQLVAGGKADALVSAGSTGATLAASLLGLGRLPGVRRPAIAALLPVGAGHETVLIDAGANADAPADVVATFAAMGVAYAAVLGQRAPRVGLLNTGAEAGKGNVLAREVHDRLASRSDFVGNTEPEAVLTGAADVVVADGFAGNLFLKTVEALAPPVEQAGGGAALLLGVDGVVLVAHGAADGTTIAKALRTAHRVAEAGLVARVAERLAEGLEGVAHD